VLHHTTCKNQEIVEEPVGVKIAMKFMPKMLTDGEQQNLSVCQDL
jgi:hypothetical protein